MNSSPVWSLSQSAWWHLSQVFSILIADTIKRIVLLFGSVSLLVYSLEVSASFLCSCIAAESALRDDYSPMQEHKKDAETYKEYTSNETDPNKRTIRLIVSAIKIENTWDK